uniref:Uncharacterized protein n=1 Tax=Anguilla anguilla TaxID=7936 RepID=A0A0E9X8X6_ANGAN
MNSMLQIMQQKKKNFDTDWSKNVCDISTCLSADFLNLCFLNFSEGESGHR